MNNHWEKATEEQVEWADAHGLWAVEPELRDGCVGCALLQTFCSGEPCVGDSYNPSIIFKRKVEDLSVCN